MPYSPANQQMIKKLAITCSVAALLLGAAIGYTALAIRRAEYCMEQTQYGGSTDLRCLEDNRRYWDYWQAADDLFVRVLWLAVPAIIATSAAVSFWLVLHNYKKFAENPSAIARRHQRIGRILTQLGELSLLGTIVGLCADALISRPDQYYLWGGLSRTAIFAGVPIFFAANTAAIIHRLYRPKA